MLIREAGDKSISEWKHVAGEAKEIVAKLARDVEVVKREAQDKVAAAEFRVEEVRREVARRVPELAKSALITAEEEWKRRCAVEVEKMRVERDQYIHEAHNTVAHHKSTLNGVKAKDMEVQSHVMKLNAEKQSLEKALHESRVVGGGESGGGSLSGAGDGA